MKHTKLESGRSMVEILGVLAIVGVLSIGGIAGYNYAINKYRANETINEINLRLQTLQLQSDRGIELNLNEFSGTTSLGYTIGDNYGWAEDDTRVYVGFSGIQKGACEIIYDEMINRLERIDVTADRTPDASTLCGDNNEMKFYVGSGVEVECDPPCSEDEICMSGIKCVKKWKSTRRTCNDSSECGECMRCAVGYGCSEADKNGSSCDNGKGICSNGQCINKEENLCAVHSDCPDGYYCAPQDNNICVSPEKGYVCAKLDFSYYPIKLRNGITVIWYRSNTYMSWANAMAACDAMGKSAPSWAEWQKLTDVGAHMWTSTDSEKACNLACMTYSPNPWQSKYLGTVYAICR